MSKAKKEVIIYAVSHGEYSDYRIDGLYSTKAKAQTYIDNYNDYAKGALYANNFDIEEYILNSGLSEKVYTRYSIGIAVDTGEVLEKVNSFKLFGIPESIKCVENINYYNGRHVARACSCKSEEHALKLAAECRQAWLREHPGATKKIESNGTKS